MTPRDERQADWILVGFMAAVIGLLAWAHETDPPVPDEACVGEMTMEQCAEEMGLDTVTAERGHDWKAAHQRMARRFATCHVSLVRAQDRLRRLGHRWSEEAHGWVRVR